MKSDKALSVHGFFRAGASEGVVSAADGTVATGLLFKRVLSSKETSQAGIGLFFVKNSQATKSKIGNSGRDFETSAELYLSEEIMPGLTIQPDIQYISYPALTTGSDGLTLGARVKYTVSF